MGSKESKKTKTQIEADYPIIKPEDCPGELMKWVVGRDNSNHELWLAMLRKELMPIKRFMKMAWQNRVWLIVLSIALAGVVVVLWIHLCQTL